MMVGSEQEPSCSRCWMCGHIYIYIYIIYMYICTLLVHACVGSGSWRCGVLLPGLAYQVVAGPGSRAAAPPWPGSCMQYSEHRIYRQLAALRAAGKTSQMPTVTSPNIRQGSTQMISNEIGCCTSICRHLQYHG